MKRSLLIIVVIYYVIGCIHGKQITEKQLNLKKVAQEQLRGIKSISLLVYVDYDIPDNLILRDEIYSLSKELLEIEGIDLGAGQNIDLSIDVTWYPIEIECFDKYLLLQVKIELSDEARLVRDPTLDNPHGYTTWSTDWVFICSAEEVKSKIKKAVVIQLEHFLAERSLAERDYKK